MASVMASVVDTPENAAQKIEYVLRSASDHRAKLFITIHEVGGKCRGNVWILRENEGEWARVITEHIYEQAKATGSMLLAELQRLANTGFFKGRNRKDFDQLYSAALGKCE
jgi:hypothetical protein